MSHDTLNNPLHTYVLLLKLIYVYTSMYEVEGGNYWENRRHQVLEVSSVTSTCDGEAKEHSEAATSKDLAGGLQISEKLEQICDFVFFNCHWFIIN